MAYRCTDVGPVPVVPSPWSQRYDTTEPSGSVDPSASSQTVSSAADAVKVAVGSAFGGGTTAARTGAVVGATCRSE